MCLHNNDDDDDHVQLTAYTIFQSYHRVELYYTNCCRSSAKNITPFGVIYKQSPNATLRSTPRFHGKNSKKKFR
jgi:hypothetical protein